MLSDRDYMNPAHGPGAGGRSALMPILIATCVIHLLQYVMHPQLTLFLQLSGGGLRSGGVWRLFTYMLAHASWWHLFVNMWMLYLFGRLVEQELGPRRFLRLYVVAGLTGGLLWVAANWNSRIPVVGASGAVFGVMGAAALLFPTMRVMLLFPPIPMKLRTLVICCAVFEILMELQHSRSQVGGGIAHLAHLGGLAGGLLYLRYLLNARSSRGGGWFGRRRTPRRPKEPMLFPGRDSGDVISSDIDPILDKIGEQGLASLTAEERAILERARKRLRKL